MTTPTADEIRSTVARSYGDRVARILERSEPLSLAGSGEACCGDSCCGEAGVHEVSQASADAEPCCDDSCCGDAGSEAISHVAKLYAGTDTSDLPKTVTDVAFGCGNPTAIAAMKEGEVVLDLGSGGGIDCFLAAKMVGPAGFVYGVDMTPTMVSLARANAKKVGAENVEFRLGEIEHLPLADQSVDVVISNCVINLAPDKTQVFREAFRVLRPGGRLQVSDMVWRGPSPAPGPTDLQSWAGCVAGALPVEEYVRAIEQAGFRSVTLDASEHATISGLASAQVFAERP